MHALRFIVAGTRMSLLLQFGVPVTPLIKMYCLKQGFNYFNKNEIQKFVDIMPVNIKKKYRIMSIIKIM